MHIETELKIDFNTIIGDEFEDKTPIEEMKEGIEQHIQDWCDEHDIDRTDVNYINELDEIKEDDLTKIMKEKMEQMEKKKNG